MTSFRQDSMTCETALQRLDALPLPGESAQTLDSEFKAACEHVQSCSVCASRIEHRQAIDHQLAELMQSVPVPVGLRDRLLAQTQSSAKELDKLSCCDPNQAESEISSQGFSRRRRSVLLAISTALLVVASSSLWLWVASQPKRISQQALFDQAPLHAAGLSQVTDWSQLPPLPTNWPRRSIAQAPCWYSPTKASKFAWMAFEISIPKRGLVRGVLMATPRATFTNPPHDWLPVRPNVNYTQRDGKPVAVAAWSERGFTYVCFVPGDATQLERVLDRIAPTPV